MTRWQDIVANPTPPAVRVGQVWKSTDRRQDRHVRVVSTDGHSFATVVRCGIDGQTHGATRRSRIRIVGDRLGRYQFVSDPKEAA